MHFLCTVGNFHHCLTLEHSLSQPLLILQARHRKMLLTVIVAVLLSAWPPGAATPPRPSAAPSCQRRCGDLDIPYPFGIGRGCYLYTGEGDTTFGLTCRLTADGTYKTFCYEVQVIGISLRRGQARIRGDIRSWCYNRTSMSMDKNTIWWSDFTDSQFRLSDEDNRFTVIGCNSLAYVGSANTGSKYMTGCMATCPAAGRLENGSCSGMGCCQAAIPRGINTYEVQFDGRFNTSRTRGFSRCSYAALVEAAAFDFRTTYVTADDFMESTGGKAPLVLDWVVGKETCGEAARNTTAYMCVSSNSECVDSRNGPGYLCNCSRGYDGNPYVHDGCQDVNECSSFKYPCSVPGTCINTPGGFLCSCPDKTTGNAYNGSCEAKKSQLGVQMAVGHALSEALRPRYSLSSVGGVLIAATNPHRLIWSAWKSGGQLHAAMQAGPRIEGTPLHAAMQTTVALMLTHALTYGLGSVILLDAPKKRKRREYD